ncbi:adenosylmethionine--8-amino-7-oxononanoate transaminase [Pseudodesulfovibrio tunisiensis]|uniref:adenosylmethionine--8-amino-7-oxononanoate transaminase n=1 Tax=Pseudodesulfovibrio tunisiensis TaxID=463192 RepID=UPI001FB4421C|nr:adenosylmethionine--8-amino-7-oxononanoate transaminase [Pseudodesulfovibrio tunisiensis]
MERQTIWHPCTQMKDLEQYGLIRAHSGKGIYIYDEQGKSYIDAVSSWWVNLFGHANPRIARAIAEQASQLEHVIFAGVTHEPARRLADRLVDLMPEDISRVFFADNGSAAVECAMKMSYGYRRNTGQAERNRFVYLTNGYHGETLGALSLCGEDLYTELYGPIMPRNIRAQGPDCFRCPYGRTRDDCACECFEHMERILEEQASEITAVMVEPLAQFAGGFKFYPPLYLKKLRECTARHGVHLILDEIATGFGRTGTMFAMEQAGITPDLVCVSKGVTSGTLPLSAVLTTDEIYGAFYADYTEMKAFLHSHSYTGNPLACAAAVETLNIFRDDDVINVNRAKAAHLRKAVEARFAGHPNVGEIRSLGFICAVELVSDPATKEPFDWKARTGYQIYRKAVERGALLRNLGDVVYFLPPYVITEEQIDELADIAIASVTDVLGE